MRILLILIISFGAMASELIVNSDTVSKLNTRLSDSNYKNFTRMSPYFNELNIPKVIIKKSNRCMKLNFYQNSISHSKVSCSISMNLTLAGHPGFKSINFKTNLPNQKTMLREESIGTKYSGVAYKYFLRDLHTASLEDFNFDFTARSYFVAEAGKITLLQTVTFSRDEFHFLPSEEKVTSQIIDLKKGDLLFKKGNSEFIIYKRYQSKPLNFKFLWLNPSYESYLSSIQSMLFEDGDQKYCFMDYHVSASPFDCENLAFGSGTYKRFQSFNLIQIDLNGSISLL
jgi:hypothetical protein